MIFCEDLRNINKKKVVKRILIFLKTYMDGSSMTPKKTRV